MLISKFSHSAMRVSPRTLLTTALLLLAICSTPTSAQTATGVIRGEVTDVSGGVLPGVTVVATSLGDSTRATTVTDDAGRYLFAALPAGPIELAFHLDGFDSAVAGLDVHQGAESWVVERLRLARITENVIVYAKAPVDLPPPPPVPVTYLPPPPPVVIPVPVHDVESVCGPAKAEAMPEALGTIRSHSYEAARTLYVKGDELIIDGGTRNGLEIGRNLAVRRHYHADAESDLRGMSEHTSGILQIVAATEHASTAIVIYACDEMMQGDFLASFKPEPIRRPDPAGIPDYSDAVRILFADAGQTLGSPRRLMVIDRGSEQDVQAGQRLTLFRRDPRAPTRPVVVGQAIVVSVRADSATIRVERVTDAISSGDWAAPHRQPPTPRRD